MMQPSEGGHMRLVVSAAALGTLASVGTVLAQTPQAPAVVAIRASAYVDAKASVTRPNAVVLVQGSRIMSVGSDTPIPTGADVIDLGGLTLLPGLIDVHTHLLQNYEGAIGGDDPNMLLTVAQMSAAKRALLGGATGREDLLAGITAVRDLGNSGYNGDVALRDAIEAGWVLGPRMQVSTRALSATGGQFGGLTPEAQGLVAQEYAVVNGADDARRAVRQAMYDGADVIKVIVNTNPRVLSLEEMKAIVGEAHGQGRPVAAHAIGDASTRVAAEAGVNSIEHGYTIPDDVLAVMAKKGIFLVPTDYPGEYYNLLKRAPVTDAQRESTAALVTRNRDRLLRAVKAGVRIAFGSDEYYNIPGKTRGEASLLTLRAYADDGLRGVEIVRAATTNAAELLGWSRRVGSLEAGLLADIIAVEGDPLKDPRLLEHVRFVMKGGKIVRRDAGAK
jgi:imidazolonepropionase-like amidohydrolase